MTSPNPAAPNPWPERWQRFSAAALRGFHAYASWLVSISWKRFLFLSLLLLIVANLLQSLPPFSWRVTETIEDSPVTLPLPKPPAPPAAPMEPTAPKPSAHAKGPGAASAPKDKGVDINVQIDEKGIRITPREKDTPEPEPAASAAEGGIEITVPANVDKAAIREAVEEAKAAIREAIANQKEAAREAAEAAREAARAAREAGAEVPAGPTGKIRRVRNVHWGDFLVDLSLLWIVASAIVKATYKGRLQAEVKAAQAAETAEAESLKRQVVEARMAAMQAQVEPHFLFNTLASIDHLIETDPARASQMQKNLIALLRASMPTMREASGGNGGNGVRDLGRELAVIRPYLEILKVRMEERLATEIAVPEGLLSAEFPPMMIQTLVENAIKHGLEPKPEGGRLTVKAEIVHGKLAVSVADTGLGFGRAPTAGTGVGLANIRERLQLLYGSKASLTVAENPAGGTIVTVTVPYKSIEMAAGAATFSSAG
ncbi:MAG: sensor histidine kinase [Rubrivivax sp.]